MEEALDLSSDRLLNNNKWPMSLAPPIKKIHAVEGTQVSLACYSAQPAAVPYSEYVEYAVVSRGGFQVRVSFPSGRTSCDISHSFL